MDAILRLVLNKIKMPRPGFEPGFRPRKGLVLDL